MLSLLISIRCWRKAKVIPKLPLSETQEIVRNAMAYAWEVGHGQPLKPVLDTTPENPFMNKNWREAVIDG